jgi:predicted sulfurtransferase
MLMSSITLTNDSDTIVVDMRNHYEFEVGHFENAIEIPSDTFSGAIADGGRNAGR